MTEKVNPPDQTPQKTSCINIVQIDITRETLGRLQGLEQKVHEILRKNIRVSHDKVIQLLMEFSKADDILSEWILEYSTPMEIKKCKKKK